MRQCIAVWGLNDTGTIISYSHDEAFCKNPLLLTIMMLIYEQHRTIPTHRHEFYNEAFAVLFQRHDLNKDGFMRDLRSKLSETEFKDIFAEFCAKTYFREKFEFTKDQFIGIVSSLNSWRKVKDRTGTDQFLIDACVNLCIMDECRTEYRFIHRSFQEYFCACWLRDKSDAQLTAKIEFFEAQQKRTMEDCVFSMLHEMAEERVDEHMIIPVLERCLSQQDGIPGYWSYLMNQYPTIPYVVGKDIDMPFNPQSAILLYILEKESFLHDDLLVDSVQASRFITERKSRELIKKLSDLAGEPQSKELNRHVLIAGRIKSMNESIYYNVDEIHKAINSDSQISFQYFQWGLDKEMELKRDGARYVVSPWALVFDDENYYMVAVEGNSLKHYRVDKMLRIKASGDPRAGRELYHEEEYGKKSLFGMYGGDIVPVTFQAKNWMIGIMIDRFGRDIPIARVNDEEFETRAEVAISPQFFGWLFALGPDIRVSSPGYVVNKLREYGENVMRNYQHLKSSDIE